MRKSMRELRRKRKRKEKQDEGKEERQPIKGIDISKLFGILFDLAVEVDWQRSLCSISESLVLFTAARVESHEQRFRTYS
jgi:hypothetical protein